MNTFCPTPENPCTDPAVPVVNYSSEAPDNIAYFGRKYNPGLQPPLGSPWRSTGCIGTCVSEVSQAEADLCAARQVITCLATEWPVYEDNPSTDPDQPPVITRDRQTFDNDPQSCDFTCPDGEVFTYTIPAGTVRAFSQAAADASALSMACNGAIDNRICIGELSPQGCCVDSDYLATVNVSSPRLGQQGVSMVVTVSDGVLPPGLGLDYDDTTFTISGTATSAGQYQFTIQVDLQEEGFAASFMQKTFTIYVMEISTTTLANGSQGNAYSETLTTVGAFGDVTWTQTGGTLPTGLTLNSNGTIDGTPTADGTYTFTVSAQDGAGSVCSKEFSIEISGGACCFSNTAAIPVASGPSPSCYAITDNRIIVIGTVNNLIFINATTDAVVSTVPAFGTVPSFLIYSPVNNRAYCIDISNGDILVINPTTMAHIGTIASPAAALQFGEPCYDATNDLIYWLASDILTNNYIFRLNPVTGIADVLATIPLPIAPAVQNWGKRCDHCSTNNRIYAPVFDDDGLGSLTASIQVYSVAGVLQTTIATPGVVTSSSSGEMVYWDATNSAIYYISDNAVADAPGVVVINPADNSTLASIALTASGVGSACLSPDCLSLNVLTGLAGVYSLSQVNTDDYSIICTTAAGMTAITGALQVTSITSKVYVPDVLGVRVVVMTT